MTSDSTTPTPLDDLLYFQREDGIHVYRFLNVSRPAVDRWYELVIQNDLAAAQAGAHSRSVYDIRGHFPTPYAVAASVRLSRQTPSQLIESIAIVVGDNLTMNMVRNVLRRLSLQEHRAEQSIRLFADDETALNWLQQRLHEFPAQS